MMTSIGRDSDMVVLCEPPAFLSPLWRRRGRRLDWLFAAERLARTEMLWLFVKEEWRRA